MGVEGKIVFGGVATARGLKVYHSEIIDLVPIIQSLLGSIDFQINQKRSFGAHPKTRGWVKFQLQGPRGIVFSAKFLNSPFPITWCDKKLIRWFFFWSHTIQYTVEDEVAYISAATSEFPHRICFKFLAALIQEYQSAVDTDSPQGQAQFQAFIKDRLVRIPIVIPMQLETATNFLI